MTTNSKNGFTLVELLTVVAILAVLFALLIPQVRMLTKDRSIRESARIVGSAVAEATSKARVDGFAGIELVRNPNVVRTTDSNEVFYSCYEIYQLRQPRSYVGNSSGDRATVARLGTASIFSVTLPELPLDPNVDISRGFIRLNHSRATYPITSVSGTEIMCSVPSNYELPPEGELPFELIRQPVRRQSSLIEVPQGYVINLNYSGPIDLDNIDRSDLTWTRFSQISSGNQESVFIIFDSTGGIDRIFPNGLAEPSFQPDGAIHLCVAADEIRNSFAVGSQFSDNMAEGTDLLDDPTIMWVTLNHLNGSVTVAENAVPETAFPSSLTAAAVGNATTQRLTEALEISGGRLSARQ